MGLCLIRGYALSEVCLKRGSTVIQNFDDDGPVEPHPTRREVLKAVSTIGKYTNDLNDPFAQKIEALLGSFTRQLRLEETRRMKNAFLTDFFK